MWKALIVMFVAFSSPPPGYKFVPPPGMIFGEMPEVFVSEADCKSFIEARRKKIEAGIVDASKAPNGMEIVTHDLTCIKDRDGQLT